ncbi:Hypothetical predicted protein [Pelobates cultripes]|uniref:Uncharacterized protein n=1 Tax=Pelobates cultripes TaxID=61616 RepID=A0AAD1R6C9_PELCU|nr:Hypothetical predicted protein [Pelobates cultripes]
MVRNKKSQALGGSPRRHTGTMDDFVCTPSTQGSFGPPDKMAPESPSQDSMGDSIPDDTLAQIKQELAMISTHMLTKADSGGFLQELRTAITEEIKALRTDLSAVEETHFQGGEAPVLGDRRFPAGFANHRDAKKAGVAILFASTVPFTCLEELADPNGSYLFIKGTIADRRYTFASVRHFERQGSRTDGGSFTQTREIIPTIPQCIEVTAD